MGTGQNTFSNNKDTMGRTLTLDWIHCVADENRNTKTELYSGSCVQDSRNPFVLECYCVSPGVVGK